MKALGYFTLAVVCIRVARLSDIQDFSPWPFLALGLGWGIAWFVTVVRGIDIEVEFREWRQRR